MGKGALNFDRVAPIYRTLEAIAFGQVLQQARLRWLAEIPEARRALIVGEGNGRFVCELLKTCPDIEVDCVETSGRMIELARQRLKESGTDFTRVHFSHADILTWSPQRKYDLLVTHFVLDCFDAPQLEGLVQKLASAAEHRATWLVSDFRIPATGTLKVRWAKIWIGAMYLFFRITAGLRTTKLIDPSPYLRAADFSLSAEELTHAGMVKSQVWSRSSPLG
jgi:ubiquinone/menaquinone biosynthesis C-methylase UbiE